LLNVLLQLANKNGIQNKKKLQGSSNRERPVAASSAHSVSSKAFLSHGVLLGYTAEKRFGIS
jgi:hypothetical protein